MNGIVKEITAVLYKSVGTTLYAECGYVYTRASTAVCVSCVTISLFWS